MSIAPVKEPYELLLKRGFMRSDECLLLKGSTANGYATVMFKKKGILAHRVSYLKWHGEIPDKFQVDHICHNEAAAKGECAGGSTCLHRRCVNPAHLRAVSAGTNWRASAVNQRFQDHNPNTGKTECPKGHEYSPENTFVYYNRRNCKICKQARLQAWRLNGGNDRRRLQRARRNNPPAS
jgi:hypothetical protein